jgi:tetratricopeptide (TPR) repeat protein
VRVRQVVATAVLFGAGAWPGETGAAAREAACAGVEQGLQVAARSLESGRWAEAEERLRPLTSSRPACTEAVLGLARARAGQRDSAGAEALFERAVTLAPADARAQALFAQYWLSRGQVARADYLSARALFLDPDCPEALVAQGRVLAARGRIPEAQQAFEEAVRVSPASVEAHYELGVLLYHRLMHPDAVRELERVVARRPEDARAWGYLAQCYEMLGEADKGEAAYRSGLKANDGPFPDPFLDYSYGRFLLKERRLDESRAHLDRAVALHPVDRAVRYERAKLSLARGDYPAAREDAERALNLRDAGPVLDLQVYYLLATIYRRLGEDELARKYAELARTTPIPGQ